MNLRAQAARILMDVLYKKISLSDALEKQTQTIKDSRDRALVQAICYGVCRWYFYLEDIAKQLLHKPLKTKDQDIYLLILIGLYQLIDMRLPDHAAIFETVDACKKQWAKGLINAALRNFQRRAQQLTVADHASHPEWMVNEFKKDWPDDWQQILTANNQHPPFSLRVNLQKISRENFLKKCSGQMIAETKSGVTLDVPIEVENIPGFAEGEVSVQDGAAQLAAELLQLSSNEENSLRILDACAAPGGKACHILELAKHAELVAVDCDAERLRSIQENLKRLHFLQTKTKLICADASQPADWWDRRSFTQILLDAPCSGSGVIRRHPDIKLLRESADIKNK